MKTFLSTGRARHLVHWLVFFILTGLAVRAQSDVTVLGPMTYVTNQTVPAANSITTGGTVTVASGTSVSYQAGSRVDLKSGFSTGAGASFHAFIGPTFTSTAPSITAQPQAVTASAGGSVTLTASAVGTGPLSYQWRRNGINISGATGATLTLSSLAAGNTGNYDVIITNAYGSIISTAAGVLIAGDESPADGGTTPVNWPDKVGTSTKAVGLTAGQLNVDKSGALNYSIPLWVVPGTAGMEPKLALNYSSQAGSGIAGFGWSLGGISLIARGPQTLATDGQIHGVDYSANDRFYFDGQRLIAINGGTYGADSTQYRTEMESFSKVVSYGSAGSGPAYFKVWTKAGLIIEFGNSPDSAAKAVGRTEVATWAVNKISDTEGNYMTFTYATDSVNGEQRLTEIDYTGHGTGGTYASVQFGYEARNDTFSGYVAGSPVRRTQRLKTISAYYGSTLVRKYTLDYVNRDLSPGDQLGRSLLMTLHEADGAGKEYPPLTFNYDQSGSGFTQSTTWQLPTLLAKANAQPRGSGFVDLNGDGRPDLVVYHTDASGGTIERNAWLNTVNGWVKADGTVSGVPDWRPPVPLAQDVQYGAPTGGARIADINGDGLPDLYSYGTIYRNTGSGFLADSGWAVPHVDPSTVSLPDRATGEHAQLDASSTTYHQNPLLVDLDGDGRIDIVETTWISYFYWQMGSTKEYHQLPYAEVWMNTGSGWVAKHSYAPALILNQGTRFIDVNGDGLPDQVQSWKDIDGYFYQAVAINTGSGFDVLASSRSLTFVTPNLGDNTRYLAPVLFNTADANNNPLPVGTEVVDLNGDGLPDLICRNDPSGTYHGNSAWLNTGNGWVAAPSGFLPPFELADTTSSKGVAILDVNSDGIPDLIEANGSTFDTRLGGASSWTSSVSACNLKHNIAVDGVGSTGSDFIDVNADGAIDQVWGWQDGSGNVDEGAALSQAKPADRLTTVTNGFGVTATIAYAPLTDQDSTGAYTVYDRSTTIPAANVEPGAANTIGPMYVVKSVANDNGTAAGHVIDYRYGGMRVHRLRGNLGFDTMTTTDELTGVISTTSFRQDYPYIGMPSASVTIAPAPTTSNAAATVTVSSSSTLYARVDLNSGLTHFMYPSVVTSTTRDLNRDSDANGAIVSQSTTTTGNYDSHGNVGQITVDTGEGYVKTTTNTYTDDETNWFLGRLTKSVVVAAATGQPSITRTSAFTYYADTGLLHEEIVEPHYDSNNNLTNGHDTLHTTYGYDAWGNKNNIKITGWDDNANAYVDRITQTGFDSIGRLAASSTNALNQTETYDIYDQGLGALKQMTGQNSLPTSWTYDTFGTKTGESRADGTTTSVAVNWVDTTNSIMPTGALYFVETAASGGAPSLVFYDRFGRKIETVGLDGNGQMIFQETMYDALNRAYKSSVPHRSGGAVYWSQTTSYDVLNRPLTVQTPDDQASLGYVVSSFNYKGLTVDSTDAKGRVVRTVKNLQGWVSSTTRDSGGPAETAVSFQYDAVGNLLSTTAAGATTSMTYDTRGRKITMTDPDMGGTAHPWGYSYNGFGELIAQTDAKGQSTTLAYDLLGRMVTHTEAEDTTTWTYDQAIRVDDPNPANRKYWLGKLSSVAVSPSGYAEVHTYDTYGRPSKVTRTIDGHAYPIVQTYDSYSRPLVTVYPTAFAAVNVYNAFGFIKAVRHAVSDGNGGFQYAAGEAAYWQADSYTTDGRIDGDSLGNGLTGDIVYSPATGRLLGAAVGIAPGSGVQFLTYGYDAVGNVLSRNDAAMGRGESFTYDTLDRLTGHTAISGLGISTVSVGNYGAIGNIGTKSDVGTYAYGETGHGAAGPHAVTSISGGPLGAQSFYYDANGNMTSGYGRTITWTSFNQALSISDSAGHYSTFAFGAAHERVKQVANSGTTLYVGGIWEKVTSPDGSSAEEKNYVITPAGRVASVSFGTSQPVAGAVKYFHTDGLGSITAVSDAAGNVIARFAYDAWGKQSDALTGAAITSANTAHVTRGYTGHEMLADLGLIHMNGRVYDPVLGRFLSADPNVDGTYDSQGYNRYSYVGNNPLSRTDPTGYFSWGHLFGFILFGPIYFISPHFFNTYGGQILSIVTAVAVTIVTGNPVLGAAAAGFVSGFTGSLLNGGSIGDAFRNGIVGALNGTFIAMAGYLGGPLGAAAASGAISDSEGQGFGSGFVSSLAGSIFGQYNNSTGLAGLVTAAVVGGTVSVIGGGKFGSGAAFAAFSYLVSSYAQDESDQEGAPDSTDAFSIGGKSVGTTTGFTQQDYNDALALLKATKPDYYNNVISKLKLSTYSGATDDTKAYSGYSNAKAGTVSVNLDSTVAAQKFSGTAAQFLAAVILHESTHIEYYREGFRNNPGASPAMEEASIRYWVEDWAIRNGIPQTVPDGRSGTGFFGNHPPFTPNFSSIYDGVVHDGYSTDPFKKP